MHLLLKEPVCFLAEARRLALRVDEGGERTRRGRALTRRRLDGGVDRAAERDDPFGLLGASPLGHASVAHTAASRAVRTRRAA